MVYLFHRLFCGRSARNYNTSDLKKTNAEIMFYLLVKEKKDLLFGYTLMRSHVDLSSNFLLKCMIYF